MSLLGQELKEIRVLNSQLMSGGIDPEKYKLLMIGYSQSLKRTNVYLQMFVSAAKHGKKITNAMGTTNLISENQHIDFNIPVGKEKIHCPDAEKLVTREECLDYSGDGDHVEDCKTCAHFKENRQTLLGE